MKLIDFFVFSKVSLKLNKNTLNGTYSLLFFHFYVTVFVLWVRESLRRLRTVPRTSAMSSSSCSACPMRPSSARDLSMTLLEWSGKGHPSVIVCGKLKYISYVELTCDSRFQRAFTACVCVSKVCNYLG